MRVCVCVCVCVSEKLGIHGMASVILESALILQTETETARERERERERGAERSSTSGFFFLGFRYRDSKNYLSFSLISESILAPSIREHLLNVIHSYLRSEISHLRSPSRTQYVVSFDCDTIASHNFYI